MEVWGVWKVEMWLKGFLVCVWGGRWLAGGDGRIACTRSLSLVTACVTNRNCQSSEAERRGRGSE